MGRGSGQAGATDQVETRRTDDGLMMVNATQLLAAAEQLEAAGVAERAMTNGVVVTPAQLRKAGEILADGPQPVANGIKSDMPAFIHRDQQREGVLVFKVGILPSRTYEITADGEVSSDN